MKAGANRAVAGLLIVGLLASVVLAAAVSFYSSSAPDGLQSVAQEQGFADTEDQSAGGQTGLAGYDVAGVDDERTSIGLAGIIGVAITAVAAFGLFLFLSSGKPDTDPALDPAADPRG